MIENSSPNTSGIDWANVRLPRNAAEAADFERIWNGLSSQHPDRSRVVPDVPGTTSNTVVQETTPLTSASLLPDLTQAGRFLDLLDQRGVFTFQTFSDREELIRTFIGRDGKEKRFDPFAKVFHGTLENHAKTLAVLNRQGAGVFVMINEGDGVTHKGKRTCRTEASVIAVRALFVDLDGAPLEPLTTAEHPPSIVVESSPGRYHGYWLRIDCPLESFEPTQIGLARRFSGDERVCDLPRVLRLPGFFHQKHEPFMTRIIVPQTRRPS